MKNLEFVELNAQELEEVNGGGIAGPPMSHYVSADAICRTNKMIDKALSDAWDYVKGFCTGFFNL